MLVPVLGLMQISTYAHADRYTYLPQIGLLVGITWTAWEAAGKWREERASIVIVGMTIVASAALADWWQVGYWRSNESLWRHALEVTNGNFFAHNNLGDVLMRQGRVDEAANQFEESVAIRPNYARGHNDLGNAYVDNGQLEDAISEFRKACTLDPDSPDFHRNLGGALTLAGKYDEAQAEFERAIQLKPDFGAAYYDFGLLLARRGDFTKSAAEHREAVKCEPNDARMYYNLGDALWRLGDYANAIASMERAIELAPGAGGRAGKTALAWMLATAPTHGLRDGPKAIELLNAAHSDSMENDPGVLRVLAAASAQTGDFESGDRAAAEALQEAKASKDSDLTANLSRELTLYKSGRVYEAP
jgi:protein O-mannosyl-transferase